MPRDRRRALAAGIELPDRVRGAALFADISGFTPLTEALAEELGAQRGAEELTANLNRVFHGIIEELDRFDGEVIYFSGDAITCWIDGDDGIRAAACGLAMQEAMARVGEIRTPAGQVLRLAMKVAVAVGPARRFVVGDPEIQLIDVLAGRIIDQLAAAEHLTEKGEVAARAVGARGARGPRRARRVADRPGERPARGGAHTPDRGRARGAGRPGPLRARRRRSYAPGYSLRCTSGSPPAAASSSRSCAPRSPCSSASPGSTTTTTTTRSRSSTSSSAARRRSSRRTAATSSSSRSATRARTCTRSSARRRRTRTTPRAPPRRRSRSSSSTGRPPRASSSSGSRRAALRSGTYGHAMRRTFVCLGDPVNLAARLMSHAWPGQVLATQDVQDEAGGGFTWEELDALTVKGKEEPDPRVRAHRPNRARAGGRQVRYELPIVGRAEELAALDAALAQRGGGAGVGRRDLRRGRRRQVAARRRVRAQGARAWRARRLRRDVDLRHERDLRRLAGDLAHAPPDRGRQSGGGAARDARARACDRRPRARAARAAARAAPRAHDPGQRAHRRARGRGAEVLARGAARRLPACPRRRGARRARARGLPLDRRALARSPPRRSRAPRRRLRVLASGRVPPGRGRRAGRRPRPRGARATSPSSGSRRSGPRRPRSSSARRSRRRRRRRRPGCPRSSSS